MAPNRNSTPMVTGRIAVLDADPDLGQGLEPSQFEQARRQSLAGVLDVEDSPWDPSEVARAHEDGWLGLLLIDGLIVRRVCVGKRAACELFGPGDVLRPWDTDGEYDPLPITVDWLVLRESRLAVLDTAFAMRIAPWPQITSRLVSRVAMRARNLALTQAVTHLPRTHARLLVVFWLLADRWGRVGVEGITIRLPLTHETLSMLVGSNRPTVTIALQRLARADLLRRERRDSWLLTRQAIELLGRPESLAVIEEGGEETQVSTLDISG
jgi:CRP-like cAMP-binding protein